ncbi:MAG: mechanosensitive ion channel family protein [Tepidisphaeraceae bacterium]
MLVLLILRYALLFQVAAPDAGALPAPPAATQPVEGQQSLAEALGNTLLGQYAQGKKILTLRDVLEPVFWFDILRDLIVAVIGFIPRLLVALMFFIAFWLIYRGVRRVLVGSMSKAHVDDSIRDMFGHLIKWSILGFGAVIACNQIGIQITALLTGVSIIGLAIGFAAQETLANFIAGIVIFWDKPFKVGDWVTVDGTFGQVQRVTFRSTRILTLDGEIQVLPNTATLSHKLINHSTYPIQRINIPIGISYRSDIDTARSTLIGITTDDKRISPSPAPQVVVNSCADSSVNLLLRFWIEDESQERAMSHEYLEKAKKALDAARIEIPFPHLQLFVEDTPAIKAMAKAG